MVSTSRRKVRVEYTIDRIGISWRKNPSTGIPTKCVVEQRPPNWQWKLNFGSYDTEVEAMIARDYGAFLRVSAGEDAATAGGFSAADHPSVYEFEETLAIFESLKDSTLRRNEFKELIPLYYQQPKEKWSGQSNPPHKEFSRKARKDITIAIRMFCDRYPHKLIASRPATETTKDLLIDKPLHGETYPTPASSNSEVKVPQSFTVMPEFSSIFSRSSFPGGKFCHADRGKNEDISDSIFHRQSSGRSPRKQDSKYFEVRFRPDLQKWVAEFRVAEWKAVDKKVWLGNFDSKEGAACAVDSARKLLKYKKKRPASNFSCESFNTSLDEIDPPYVNLINPRDESTFMKEVTLLIKRKAQEFATNLGPNKSPCIALRSDQDLLGEGNSLELLLNEGFGFHYDNVSMEGLISDGFECDNTQLGLKAGDGQWSTLSPTSVTTYCRSPSCSTAGTSPEDEKWFYDDKSTCYNYRQEMTQIEEQSVDGGLGHLQSATPDIEVGGVNHEIDSTWEGHNMRSDDQYLLPEINDRWIEVNEFLLPTDNECFEDPIPLGLIQRDEMLHMDVKPIRPVIQYFRSLDD